MVVERVMRATSKKHHRKSAVRLLPRPRARAVHSNLQLLLINKRSQKDQAMIIIIIMMLHHYLPRVLLLLHCCSAHRQQRRRRKRTTTTPTVLLEPIQHGHQNHRLHLRNQMSTHSNALTTNRRRMTCRHLCLLLIRLRPASLRSHHHHH